MEGVKIRIKQARKASELTQQQIADAMSLSRQLVSFWENPARPEFPSLEQLHIIAAKCSTSVVWLIVGSVEYTGDNETNRNDVPLLNWSHAGHDKLPIFDNHLDVVKLPCPAPHSEHTYALTVNGRSMASTNPLEKSFPDGVVIYCDPSRVQDAANGSYVIAYLPSTQEMIFKRYGKDGANTWLESINSEYPKITEPFEIRALVIGAFQSV